MYAKVLAPLTSMQHYRLERLGIEVSIHHAEYRLRYGVVDAAGQTLDMAIAAFIAELLKFVPVEHIQKEA